MHRLCAVSLALGLAACGGAGGTSSAPPDAGAPATSSASPEPAATDDDNADDPMAQMAEGMEQFARGLQQMVENQATAVQYEVLQDLLPEISGWTRTNARGEQGTTPVAYSRAEAHYERGDAEVELEIQDTALSQLLIAPFSMFLASGFSERSSEGFKRATEINGSPGYEEWTESSRRGEVMAFVANRFVVRANGDGVESLDTVHEIIDAVNLEALGRLK